MTAARSTRIFWLVRWLVVIGLLTVVLTLGLVGWTLTHIRRERAEIGLEKQKLDQAALALREAATLGQQEIEILLADQPQPGTNSAAAVEKLLALVSEQMRSPASSINRSNLDLLQTHASQLAVLAGHAQRWQASNRVVFADLQAQRSLGRVREILTELRIAVDTLEGCRRLEDAKKFRRWWAATGTEAAQLASGILLEQSQRQSRDTVDFRNQLSECARLVEMLAGEEQFDNLANLKDNQFKPIFDRMSQAMVMLQNMESVPDAFTTTTLEQLKTAIFGAGCSSGETHQSIVPGEGGLFPLRLDVLRLRRERERLQQTLADVGLNLEADVVEFTQSIHARTAALTQEMESSLASGWRKLLCYGIGGSLVFLWLALLISRDVKTQVNALDHARAAAEEGRATTQKLMHEQQKVTAALAETSSLLETMLENCPDHIYFKDRESRFVYFSKSFRQVFQLEHDGQLRGKRDFDFFTREHAQQAYDDEQEVVRTGQPIIGKVEKETHADGHVTWVMTSKLPWRDKAGQIIGMFGISTDVTAMKDAEARLAAAHLELQASELRFRSLSALAPIGIFLCDVKGAALYLNPHWLNITGLTLEQSLTKGWERALHPDDADAVLTAWKAASRNGWGFNHEFRFCRPSGEVRWVQTRAVPVRSQAGAVTGYVGTTEDITERRKSEELLRLQEAALRSAANVVVITNREGNIVWTNPAFTRVTGYTAAEALGRNPRVLKNNQVAATTYPANYYQDLWKTIASGQVWHGEFHNSRKDGSDLIEDATITPVPDAKGEITHFVAVKQDITARKHAEAELATAQKELVALSRQAGMAEVATGVLHNVGNVLNSVNVTAACVAERVRKSKVNVLPKVADLLRTHAADLPGFFATDPKAGQLPVFLSQLAEHLIGEQSRALAELADLQKHVDHIKDIVVMQQSFATVSGVAETLAVTDLLEDALKMNASALIRHDIRIRKEFETTPVITVDKHKALQIFINLLNNAKQACDEAGRDDKQITLRVMHAAGRVRVSVTDNGVGIPPEHLDRIFNHGFTTKKNGHGFGLHSGANAAREMGGNLQVHSEGAGRGATFTVELPMQSPEKGHAKS